VRNPVDDAAVVRERIHVIVSAGSSKLAVGWPGIEDHPTLGPATASPSVNLCFNTRLISCV
jgi:hypothetical protein